MSADIMYSFLLTISGIFVSGIVVAILTRFFNGLIKRFALYPESKGIVNIALKLIAWFVGLIVFLVFFRLAFSAVGMSFATAAIEEVIFSLPKYILAILIVITGFYFSRMIRERAGGYTFEFKNQMLIIIDLIVAMTFVFTALEVIGIDMNFFLVFYTVLLWIIGIIAAMILSMSIGIPLGMSIYEKTRKKRGKKRQRRRT